MRGGEISTLYEVSYGMNMTPDTFLLIIAAAMLQVVTVIKTMYLCS